MKRLGISWRALQEEVQAYVSTSFCSTIPHASIESMYIDHSARWLQYNAWIETMTLQRDMRWAMCARSENMMVTAYMFDT